MFMWRPFTGLAALVNNIGVGTAGEITGHPAGRQDVRGEPAGPFPLAKLTLPALRHATVAGRRRPDHPRGRRGLDYRRPPEPGLAAYGAASPR